MKFIIIISHFISHNLNQICEPFEKFDNFYIINWVFITYERVFGNVRKTLFIITTNQIKVY